MVESESGRKTSFVKMTGLNAQLVDWTDRTTEFYAFNKDMVLDYMGKTLRPIRSQVAYHVAHHTAHHVAHHVDICPSGLLV
jgi:hypothetical protein